MRVKGWFIEGFGIFRDFEVGDLGPGMTVFAGPNEAGKSTLLGFLRGMLFGFADARSREPRYLPLRGGRHGGRVILATRDGNYIVERYAGGRPPVRVTGTNGRTATDGTLRTLLGGADDRLFRSVFAFSLTELQSFDSLSEEGVRDRIFSAGIAGAGRSARGAARELDDRMSAILKARGQATINTLLAELTDLRGRIDAARASAASYADIVLAEEQRKADIDRLGQESDLLRSRMSRAAMLADLWPAWHDLQAARGELAIIDPIDQFPEGGEARLAAILQEAKTADEVLAELTTAHREAEERCAELSADDALAAVAAEVEHLHEMVALQRNLLQQLPTARLKLFQTRESLEERLRSLGPDWTEDRVGQFDQSIPRQEEVRNWQERLERSAYDVDRISREVETVLKNRDEIQQARDRIAASLPPHVPDEKPIDDQIKLVRRIRANLNELRADDVAAQAQDAIAKDRERALGQLDATDRPAVPAWIGAASAVLGIVAGGAAGWRITLGDMMTGGGLAVAALVGLIGAVVVSAQRNRQVKQHAEHAKTRAVLSAELDVAASGRVRHRHKAAILNDTIAEDSVSVGLQRRPSFQDVEEKDAELARKQTERMQHGEATARLAEVEAKLADAIHETQRFSSSLENAQRLAADLRATWDDWKANAQLPESLSPQGVLDYFEAIRVAREHMLARKSAKTDGVQLTERIGGWEERAGAVLNAVGVREILTEEQLIDQIIGLRRRCVEDQQVRATHASLEQDIRLRAQRIAAAQAVRHRCADDRGRLLAQAAAVDEMDFRSRFQAYQRRNALMTAVQGLDKQIVTRIGQGPEADALRAEVATGRVEEWRQIIAASETRALELQQLRDEAVAKHRDAQRMRTDLESSADVARLETEREGLVAELTDATRDWRVARMAGTLIDETLREFERTRQPEVLAEASRTFSFITRGRYERLVQEDNTEEVIVMDTRGGRRPVEGLSRGTAEQLYLCIRLSLAAEFARRSEGLPVVMDDVFVNFDPERAEAVARVVAEFAKDHQVLVFTCHPSTRDMLRRIDPTASVVELQPNEPVAPAARAQRRPIVEPTLSMFEEMPAAASANGNQNIDRLEETPLLDLLETPPPLAKT